jgi:hypothetical protein
MLGGLRGNLTKTIDRNHKTSTQKADNMKKQIEVLELEIEELEERIAPGGLGNPGNNNPPLNNTNNPGNEGTGGQVSTGP